MAKIALLSCDTDSKAKYLETIQLPATYMEDFTLLGFVVDRYQDALSLLTDYRYRFDELNGGADIFIDAPQDLLKISSLFKANNIKCDISDIADSLYQA